ncbi:MAG: hypothetical protein ACI9H6_000548 [Patiriisocius sp.]
MFAHRDILSVMKFTIFSPLVGATLLGVGLVAGAINLSGQTFELYVASLVAYVLPGILWLLFSALRKKFLPKSVVLAYDKVQSGVLKLLLAVLEGIMWFSFGLLHLLYFLVLFESTQLPQFTEALTACVVVLALVCVAILIRYVVVRSVYTKYPEVVSQEESLFAQMPDISSAQHVKNIVVTFFMQIYKGFRFAYRRIKENKKVQLVFWALFVAVLIYGAWLVTRPVELSYVDIHDAYELVREGVPLDGPIIMRLPEGVTSPLSRFNVTFEPDIQTYWGRTTESGYLVFRLGEDMLENDFYSVTYTDADGVEYVNTFKAVQRPRVEIFEPGIGSTIEEDTVLTFTFNRPMIPLEGLDREYETDLPVTINPPTPGQFRWVSQRQLEFVPDVRLQRSSDYTVRIEENFRSSDGLVVPPATYTFTVKPLSMWAVPHSVRAQDPFTLRFNQPVDIDALTVNITGADGEAVTLEKEYDSVIQYNAELGQKERVIDRSIVHIRQVDQQGRWLFGDTYQYSLQDIRPLEGVLTVPNKSGQFTVTPLLVAQTAYSPRVERASLSYFDPNGVVRLQFSEPVAIDGLSVEGKGVTHLAYLDRCDKDNGTGCSDSLDTSIVEVHFDESQFGFAEDFELSLGSVYGIEGNLLGDLQRTLSLKTYGNLEITAVVPADSREKYRISICSSNPLISYSDTQEGLITTTQPITEFYRTNKSRYITTVANSGFFQVQPLCAGSYKTDVQYELEDDTQYAMTFTPTDVFGNRASYDVDFKTLEDKAALSGLAKPWLDNLHRAYTVTTPEKTQYTYTAGNLDHVTVRVCKLQPAEMIRTMGQLTRSDTGPDNCQVEKNFEVTLPDTEGPDYFQVNLADYYPEVRGHYVITVTNPELSTRTRVDEEFEQYYDHMYTSITNLSLVEKRTNQFDLTREGVVERKTDLLESGSKTNLYWVTDLRTLQPVTDAQIFVYKDTLPGSERAVVVGTNAVTNLEGVARTEVVPDAVGTYVVHGEDSAIVTSWGDSLSYASGASEAEQVYVYTDRPIYRPGHEVSLKGIHRIGYDGAFEIYQAEDVVLNITNARRETIKTETVSVNEYGTFNTILKLPEDASLGSYAVNVSTASGRRLGYSSFSVEEYVGAPFEVTTYTTEEEYVAGDTMDVTVDAQYFFGAPIPEGTVSYTVSTQDYFFDRSKDARFRFGGNWYQCWYCSSRDQFLTRGEGELVDGVFNFQQALDFETLFAQDEDDEDDQGVERSKIFVVKATVTDGNGKSVSTQGSFIVHKAQRYVAVKSSDRLIENNTPASIAVKTVTTDGTSVSQEIELVVKKREWKEFKRREVDGSFYTQSELVRTEVSRQTVVTDVDGYTSVSTVYPEPGQYEITATGYDATGNSFSEMIHQYVYGSESASVRHYNDRTLDIAVEDTDLLVGEQSKLIIQSPFEKAKALITIERGSVMDYEIVDVDANYFDYDFIAKKEHAPNIVTSVVLISGDPSVKYGTVRFSVDRQVHNLDIAVTSNKEVYLPGEEVTLYVETKDWEGVPVPAEVSIAAVDLSVLALKGNPEKDPLLHFYRGFPHSVITSANLKFVHEEIEIPTGTKGGGGNAEDLARRERGVFKDTAFWEAAVETDASGRAVIRFTLPDNLTRWRVETIGVTKDTKVGVDYMEFTERKDLITTPLVPRFVLPGDTISLGAEVLNRTDVVQQVAFSVESEGLELAANEQYASIPPKSAKRFFVEIEVPRETPVGSFTARFSAKNNAVEDTIVKTIPVADNTFFESVFSSDFTDGSETTESFVTPSGIQESFGGVRVKVFTTVGAYLEDSVNYMADYPYGCSEQLASKIATLATAEYLASLDNLGEEYVFAEITHDGESYTVSEAIEEGLDRMYTAQSPDGGFGYYYGLHSDIALSLHIVSVLQTLQSVGVAVDTKVLERAVAYIGIVGNDRNNRNVLSSQSSWVSRALVTAHNLQAIDPRPRVVDTAIQDIRVAITRQNVQYFSTQDLMYAALLTDELWWFDKWSVWREVEKRLQDTPDGTYVQKYSGKIAKSYYETDVKNAALALRAIIKTGRLDDESANILRWLLSQRSDDGAWSTTNTTHEVVQALTEYVVWKDEQHAAQTLELLLDGEGVGNHDPTQEPRLMGLVYEEGFEVLGTSTQHMLTFAQDEVGERNDTMYYDIAMRYALDRDVLPARDEGVYVERHFYTPEDVDYKNPLVAANVGDLVVGRVTYTVGSPMRMVGLEDRIPAGFEIVNFDYATENRDVINTAVVAGRAEKESAAEENEVFMQTSEFQSLTAVEVYKDEREVQSPSRQSYTKRHRSSFQELHDDRIFSFTEEIKPGVYVHEYYLRALVPGVYQHLPAHVGEMYDPSFFGRTEGSVFTVLPKE